ncbi:MAG: hypothetical protein PHQ23_06580, partial [Candidatus Wallbacteria bacterium]|nr:hypothetical protein [Candidatus Wallbacteria bacterium]
TICPGEIIGISLTIKPFREDPFVKTVFLKMPDESGSAITVTVRGGKTCRNSIEEKESLSFDEIEENAQNYPQNNDIMISWTGDDPNEEGNPENKIFLKKVSTDYVLEGYFENILLFQE